MSARQDAGSLAPPTPAAPERRGHAAPGDGRAERLTDTTYWDDIWGAKPRAWTETDWGWTRRRFDSVVTDRLYRSRLKRDPKKRFLEVGCGTGRWLIYFHRTFGYAVTGCDYTESSCAMARRNLDAAGVPGTVLYQDLFTLTGEYDVIYSNGLIEHFTDPKAVLGKFTSVLQPGGTLISVVPNLSGLGGWFHRVFKPETFTTHRVVTLEELTRWYAELGLVNVEAGPVGSIVPNRLPRDEIRRRHPRLYRVLWLTFLGPLKWLSNRLCIWAFSRYGVRLESQRFSPYLYAIGDQP